MKLHKIVKEEKDLTLKDIEKGYGKKVAQALVRYCTLKKLDMDEVVSDLTTDGNGMTPWDKFDVWAQNTLGLDIMGDFDDTYDWSGAEDDRKREAEFDNMNKEERKKAERKVKRAAKRAGKRNRRARRGLHEYDTPKFGRYSEGSGSHMDEQDILDFIGEELRGCEWV